MTDIMAQIVDQCLRLDDYATRIYQLLAYSAQTDHMHKLWRRIINQNEQHKLYWNQMRIWVDNGLFINMFEDPQRMLTELQQLENKIRNLASRCEQIRDLEKAFVLAFKLEFYLLHPVFENLFQYYRTLSREVTVESFYNRHINTLFKALYENDLATLELELLGETIHRLWRENRKMAVLSYTDELTGILNRRGLFNAMNHLGHLAQRNSNTMGVLMLDIDHFKKVNDIHGHQTGDRVLKYVADTISHSIRASDALGRFGGEEFLVFLAMVDDQGLRNVGEKIRHSVEEGGGNLPAVTISIGGACDEIHKNVEQGIQILVQTADKNLLRAKRLGRNQVCA